MSERTRNVIISVVTLIWAANFVAGLLVRSYQTSESINGIFMAIVGGLFALGGARNDSRRDPPKPDDDEHPDPKHRAR